MHVESGRSVMLGLSLGYIASPQFGLQGISLLKGAVLCFIAALDVAAFN